MCAESEQHGIARIQRGAANVEKVSTRAPLAAVMCADATFAFGDNYVEEGRARGEHGNVSRASVVWASCACAVIVLAVRADRGVGVERAKALTA